MTLFLKGLIVGIAKIIPGVSGAMLAVNFGIYDKLINSITHFFDDKKNNTKFLLIMISSILISIVLFSNIVRILLKEHYLITMMLFIGLIMGGTYNFSRTIKYNLKNSLIIISLIILLTIISIANINNNYIIQNNYIDYIMFFIGGVIEIFSSIIPGISGTALLMLVGIYDNILVILSNIFNISYVINNIIIYLSYTVGMFISFIICSLFIAYLLKKYRELFDTIILGLSISSIILLIILAFKVSFSIYDLLIGVVVFFLGISISYLLDK